MNDASIMNNISQLPISQTQDHDITIEVPSTGGVLLMAKPMAKVSETFSGGFSSTLDQILSFTEFG